MDFRFSSEEEAFREEVADYLDREVTEEIVEEVESLQGMGPHLWAFYRKLGAKGWLAPSLPREYGGIGATFWQRWIIGDELSYRRAMPVGLAGAAIVAPTLLLFGSEEQKREYIPPIARGEVDFAIGYTEPEAGSDLASLQIRATQGGDDFVINGQKVFTSAAHYARYVWLAARTDPTAPKHKGISLFIVDMKTPGITVRPIRVIDDERTNETFYDNVRVPKRNLVGELNRGFYYIGAALAFERLNFIGDIKRIFDDLVRYVRGTGCGKDPLVQQTIAQLAIEVQALYLIAYRAAWLTENKKIPDWEAPMVKLFSSELQQRLASAGMQIMGLYGQLHHRSRGAPLMGRIEHLYRHAAHRCISAGTSEITRNVIAWRGLGMPRE